jgi:putative flippase GtrA
MMYIKSFVLYAILFGAWHLIDNMLHISSHDLVDALMGLEFGVLEFFIHTAALFLLSRGCGTREMIRSAWGGLAVFSVAFVLMNRSVHIAKSDTESELPIYFYVAYRLVLILMYIVCILLPTSKLYRRPSFRPYALMVITYCLIWIILSLSLHYGPHSVYCAGFFLNFIIDGLGPPLMLFVGARIDSKVRLTLLL